MKNNIKVSKKPWTSQAEYNQVGLFETYKDETNGKKPFSQLEVRTRQNIIQVCNQQPVMFFNGTIAKEYTDNEVSLKIEDCGIEDNPTCPTTQFLNDEGILKGNPHWIPTDENERSSNEGIYYLNEYQQNQLKLAQITFIEAQLSGWRPYFDSKRSFNINNGGGISNSQSAFEYADSFDALPHQTRMHIRAIQLSQTLSNPVYKLTLAPEDYVLFEQLYEKVVLLTQQDYSLITSGAVDWKTQKDFNLGLLNILEQLIVGFTETAFIGVSNPSNEMLQPNVISQLNGRDHRTRTIEDGNVQALANSQFKQQILILTANLTALAFEVDNIKKEQIQQDDKIQKNTSDIIDIKVVDTNQNIRLDLLEGSANANKQLSYYDRLTTIPLTTTPNFASLVILKDFNDTNIIENIGNTDPLLPPVDNELIVKTNGIITIQFDINVQQVDGNEITQNVELWDKDNSVVVRFKTIDYDFSGGINDNSGVRTLSFEIDNIDPLTLPTRTFMVRTYTNSGSINLTSTYADVKYEPTGQPSVVNKFEDITNDTNVAGANGREVINNLKAKDDAQGIEINKKVNKGVLRYNGADTTYKVIENDGSSDTIRLIIYRYLSRNETDINNFIDGDVRTRLVQDTNGVEEQRYIYTAGSWVLTPLTLTKATQLTPKEYVDEKAEESNEAKVLFNGSGSLLEPYTNFAHIYFWYRSFSTGDEVRIFTAVSSNDLSTIHPTEVSTGRGTYVDIEFTSSTEIVPISGITNNLRITGVGRK